MSEAYADEPVLFVAVNSGNARESVYEYAKKNDVPWPIIVDPERAFEKACGLDNEISLQNIHQVRYVSGDGRLKNGRWDDIEGTVETALTDATWRIDPRTMPESLKQAWNHVETGRYAAAAATLKASLKSPDDEIKAAAESLSDLVMTDLKKKGRAAWALGKSGNRWEAYQALNGICEDFAGYDVPRKLVSARDSLAKMPPIQNEIRASKMLAGAEQLLQRHDRRKQEIAVKRLQSLVERFPDTKSAEAGQQLLEELEQHSRDE